MEKFSGFGKITKEYLNGKLEELKLNYEPDEKMEIKLSYEYNNYYLIDYELEVDIKNQTINFMGHHSKGYLNKIELNRERDFELAVTDYLFH